MSSPDRELVVYRYLKSLHVTTFGQSFDVINSTNTAVQWLAEVWDDLEAADKEFTTSLNRNNNKSYPTPSETPLTFCEDCKHYTANLEQHKKSSKYSAGWGPQVACEAMRKRDQERSCQAT